MNIILNLHHYLFYLLISLMIITFIYFFSFKKKINLEYYISKYKFLIKLLIFIFHIQILLGIILLCKKIYNTYLSIDINLLYIMNNKSLRFTIIEHPFIMILSFVILIILNKKIKRKVRCLIDLEKINIILLIIIILILTRIPFNKLINY